MVAYAYIPRRKRSLHELLLMSLDALMTRVASGDRTAFEDLYTQVIDRVFGTARAVLRDPSMAEEVAHDVMIEVWSKAQAFDASRGSAKAWIATITRRRAIDVVRSEQSSRTRDERVGAASISPASDPVAEEIIDDNDRARVRGHLSSLTDLQRESIELAFYGGLSYPEVATRLDVPLGTVKTRMRDGLKRLADLMGPDHG